MELGSEPEDVEPAFVCEVDGAHGPEPVTAWLLDEVLDELGWDWYYRESGGTVELFGSTSPLQQGSQ